MEGLIALFIGIIVYSLILFAFHTRAEWTDTVKRRLAIIANSTKKNLIIDDEMSLPISERIFKPMLRVIIAAFLRFLPKTQDAGRGDESGKRQQQYDKLKKTLILAGLTIGTAEYSIIRLLAIAGTGFLFGLFAFFARADRSGVFFTFFMGLVLGYTVMRYYLMALVTKRKKSMEQQLPDVLDLLSVSVEAGLGFEQAINHIVNNMQGPLINELTVTYREMSMGRTRRDALILLGDRCDIEEIRSFVGALVQAGQLGISMRNVLRSQAAAMRQARKAKVQEKAMKVSIKILIPMILFIFPVIFIIALGPALVTVMESSFFGSLAG